VAHRLAPPGRLRRRLTISFILVAGVAAGLLAIGSFLLVRQTRLADSRDRALAQSRLNLAFAESNFPRSPSPANLQPLMEALAAGTAGAVVESGGRETASSFVLANAVPSDLRRVVTSGHFALAYERTTVGGVPYVVVGGGLPGRDADLYFFLSEDRLRRDLAQLGLVLGVGWVVVVVGAGLIGRRLARRALEPVARASDAARSMAEGLLDTRLPVHGDDEFAAWAASFNRMAEALGDKITDLSAARDRERRFTSDVAHELRTPLAALVAETSLLRDHLDGMPPDARRPVEMVVHDVGRLRRLVEELIEISGMDAGSEPVRFEPTDLTALVVAVARSRGWSERLSLPTRSVTLETDPRRLERIIANLVGNALAHGGPPVEVQASLEGGTAMLTVTDHGPGIRTEDLTHVFERFYKADVSRTEPGSGLGLAIARENARLLGGDIEASSEPGRTRFTLRLPVTEPLHRREDRVAHRDEDAGDQPSTGGTA
jgi:signal transduction histidine kinase